ncbi:MAG TPA: hypothetical protein VIJ38_08750 [Acidobacteriaceae bacterium]
MQRDRLFVQADYRFGWTVGLLIYREYVFHLLDVLVIEFGDSRGRDASGPAPPAQIPTGGTTAWGSYLG